MLDWVVRDLNHGDAASPHDRRHIAFIAQPFEASELSRPGDKIVYLIQIDPPTEPGKGPPHLSLSFSFRCRPHLRRHNGLITAALQRLAKDTLGFAIHRRRVEECGLRLKRFVHSLASGIGSSAPSNVERLPGSDTDHGDYQPRAAQHPPFQNGSAFQDETVLENWLPVFHSTGAVR